MTPETQALMTETVDGRRGVIRVHGHLSVQGADLLRGTVEGLARSGRGRVLLDLQEVTGVDRPARDLLGALQVRLAAVGTVVRIVELP